MPTDTERHRGRLDRAMVDLTAALPGWVAGRVLTAVGWVVALVLVETRLDGVRSQPMVQGLFGWDGIFYRSLAEHGYGDSPVQAARFHPLFPLLGRNGLGLILLANVAALLAAALIHRLVLDSEGDPDLARRAATLVGIAPPAFCLVWAYSEGLFLLLTAGFLLALARRWWWAVAVTGTLAVLTRPTGVMLTFAVLLVLGRDLLARRRGQDAPAPTVGALVALLAPGAAMLAWLRWVGGVIGDRSLVIDIQDELRGGTRFAPFRVIEAVWEAVVDPLGDGLHLPFVLTILVLLWVAWRRLPPEWTAYAGATVFLMLSAGNLNSIERYALGTIPLVVAGAIVAEGRWWRPAVVVSGLGLVGMTALAWYGSYVP